MLAMILGFLMIFTAVLLGMRRYKSQMPLAVNNSAAISATCHPLSDDHDHALKLIQWGEIPALERYSANNINGMEGVSRNSNWEETGSVQNQGEWIPAADNRNDEMIPDYDHCSFTSRAVLTPNPCRRYLWSLGHSGYYFSRFMLSLFSNVKLTG